MPSGEVWDWPSPHPVYGSLELEYLEAALKQDDWSHSTFASRFEREFASFLGVRHAMLVPNGTSAVHLALLACGVGPGDEVLLPGITWPSVVYAIAKTGATPRTVDIDPNSLCMSARTIEPHLSSSTAAILATHLFGSQCDMEEIAALAEANGVTVIEDAAQSVGSVQSGRSCGTWGAAGAFSFNDRKVLACGEGGCVVTDSDALNASLRELQLIQPERDSVPVRMPGTYKVSEFQAAVACAQLVSLPERLSVMQANATALAQTLEPGAPHLSLQAQPANTHLQSYFNFCLLLHDIDAVALQRRLSRRLGLRIPLLYTPLDRVGDFAGEFASTIGRLDVCDEAFRSTLRLPHPVLSGSAGTIARLGAAILDELDELRLQA